MSADATCPRIPCKPPGHLDSISSRPFSTLQNKSHTKTQREYSNRKTSKITKDLNYLSIIGKVHQIAEKWSFYFSPDLPIETLSALKLRHVMRPVPNELNSCNWKQPCLAFGLGYFHHWTVGAKTYILPRKTFLWKPHLIQTELELTFGSSKDSSKLWKIVHMFQAIYEIVPNVKKKQPCTWTHLSFLWMDKDNAPVTTSETAMLIGPLEPPVQFFWLWPPNLSTKWGLWGKRARGVSVKEKIWGTEKFSCILQGEAFEFQLLQDCTLGKLWSILETWWPWTTYLTSLCTVNKQGICGHHLPPEAAEWVFMKRTIFIPSN